MNAYVDNKIAKTGLTTQAVVYRASMIYAGTCGESHAATQQKFLPAFRNEADGRVELARLPNGQVAPMHLIAALPAEWAARVDARGSVLALIDGITAGFWRDQRFYTRQQAAAAG